MNHNDLPAGASGDYHITGAGTEAHYKECKDCDGEGRIQFSVCCSVPLEAGKCTNCGCIAFGERCDTCNGEGRVEDEDYEAEDESGVDLDEGF